jgi:hypothetical protein
VISELCHSGVTVVLQWCYSGVTVVLQWCPSGDTVVSQWCHMCYSGGTVASAAVLSASHPKAGLLRQTEVTVMVSIGEEVRRPRRVSTWACVCVCVCVCACACVCVCV